MIWGENAPSKWSILPSKWDVFENHGKSPLNGMIWGDFPHDCRKVIHLTLPEGLSQRVCPLKKLPKPTQERISSSSPIIFQGRTVKLRGGRWYTREIPEKDWILRATASKQSIMCHFITASMVLMQNDGDVTIVYTHLVKFKHPTDMAFIHKYITTSVKKIAFAGSQTWCQPHKTSRNPAGFVSGGYGADIPCAYIWARFLRT